MRWTKEAWLELGANLLRERGPDALTLEVLTAAAGRTRGSFYHHFRDREVYLSELVARWRAETLKVRAAALPPSSSPAAMRAYLREEPFRLDHAFERALRQLAVGEPTVRHAVDEVDRARVDALAALIAILRPEVDDPRSNAFVQYAVVVGSQWLLDDPADPRLARIREAAYALFMLEES